VVSPLAVGREPHIGDRLRQCCSNFFSSSSIIAVHCVWNVMAHAQKPAFVFRRNGRVHLNRRGASVQSTTGSRGVRISDSNAGYTMFRGSVKSTCCPLYSPVSPSLSLPCVTVCYDISAGVYKTLTHSSSYCQYESLITPYGSYSMFRWLAVLKTSDLSTG
jgi:hypothetical protein